MKTKKKYKYKVLLFLKFDWINGVRFYNMQSQNL